MLEIELSVCIGNGSRLYYLLIKVPTICDIYKLEVTETQCRRRIRQEFEKHKFVKDVQVVDILLFKARQELEESLNCFKQPTHIMRFFPNDEYAALPSNDFLTLFYNGNK
jgi:NADH dehydrogenase (ubiquinone) 1 alpha subcomplex subunit 6